MGRCLLVQVVALALWGTACSQTADAPVPASETRPPGSLGRVGSPDDFLTGPLPGAVLLMGGGADVDSALTWWLGQARGGDVVVLRATGSTGYNDYLLGLAQVNSVETFRINSRELAQDSALNRALRKAEAVFLAGGDQWDYIRLWGGTALEATLRSLIAHKRIAIGGTSAGCAVLGQFVFTAQNGSVTSAEALANAYHPNVTLQNQFLQVPGLENLATDQHYSQRDRHGRHLVFLGRMLTSTDTARGIGVDEATAVCLPPDGQAWVMGAGNAYFLEATAATGPETFGAGQPITWHRGGQALRVYRLGQTPDGGFWLTDWQTASGGTWGWWSVQDGVLTETYGN